MNQHEQIIYLLGYIKATIESLCSIASKDDSSNLFHLLVDFEQNFNKQIHLIFS